MRFLLVALLASASLAGCAGEETPYMVTGSFTEDRTEEDIDELRGIGEELGGEVVIMESDPEQFQVRSLSAEECETFRERVGERDYIDVVGPCRESEAGANPY